MSAVDVPAIIGLTASFITVTSFVPQVVRVWRTRQTRDLSLGAFGLLLAGAVLWLAYGLLREDLPVILTNAAVGVMLVGIVAAKLRYG